MKPFRTFAFAPIRRVSALLAAIALVAASGATRADPTPEDYIDDFSAMTWPQAFDALNAALARKYPFGPWKDIQWSVLRDRHDDAIAAAAASGNTVAYYRALRSYVAEIPDGHVIFGATGEIESGAEAEHVALGAELAGGYGLILARLGDGNVHVRATLPDSPATLAGIVPSARITRWDGTPIGDALASVDLDWAQPQPAREAGRALHRLRFLARAPVGRPVQVEFVNPGAAPQQATLVAVDDAYASLIASAPTMPVEEAIEAPIEWQVGNDRVGRVRIRGFDAEAFAPVVPSMIEAFRAARVRGVVIDLRGSVGGEDVAAAFVASQFTGEPLHHQHLAVFDVRSGELVVIPEGTLVVEPAPAPLDVPVAAVVDLGAISAGEGLAMLIGRLPRGVVVGREGSQGSFGVTGGRIDLPGGLRMLYPAAQSLDADYRIQIDTDRDGAGGVLPDILVPNDLVTLQGEISGDDVVLESAVSAVSPLFADDFEEQP